MKVEALGFGIPILCWLSILAPCVNCILRQSDQFLWRVFGYVSFWIFGISTRFSQSTNVRQTWLTRALYCLFI